MQDPNEDTEWNDVLRAKGILPPKEKKVNYNWVHSQWFLGTHIYQFIFYLLTLTYIGTF